MGTQNPQMLNQLLPVLAQTNPEMMMAIQNNPEGFMRLLHESASGGQPRDAVAAMLAAAQQGGGGVGGTMPSTTVQISAEEAAAIGRLEQLGFNRQLAAEAYFACDKNE